MLTWFNQECFIQINGGMVKMAEMKTSINIVWNGEK